MMSALSPVVQEFLSLYEQSRNSFDLDLIGSLYADTFMFGGPAGVKLAERPAVLASIPKGQALLASLGHTSTTLASSSETRLDEHYAMVRARFVWRFQKGPADPTDIDVDSAFILFIKDGVARIVFQQEHEDFLEALRARGLLPRPPA
jgi:hypothetical protein